MKNIMTKSNINGAFIAVLFATVLSFGAFGFAPSAHAQYDDFGSDIGGGCCGDIAPSYIDYSSGYGDGTIAPSYIDYSSGYSDGTIAPSYIDYSSPASYDSGYSTPSYSTGGYGTSGYSTGGYSTGGYSTGGYSVGGGYMTGGGYRIGTPSYATPVASTPSNTNIWDNGNTYAPVTTTNNTCVGNSCNSDDHSVVNITNPAPVINNNNVVANYAQPAATSYSTQQYCQNGYSGVYPNCYRAQPIVYSQPPVAYNAAVTPYVSLSQVPYTGLDLGFWGSIAYWGAFVLFALFAAYLIAIKRVQNTIANYLKSVLFGTDEEVEVETVTTDSDAPAPAPVAIATTNGDVIDSFIMSQINRARA